MITIKNTKDVCALDIKRCYLPIVITDTCPKCGAQVSRNLGSDYVSYPTVNKKFTINMHHVIEHPDRDEEHEWPVHVVLSVVMEVADPA
jgi:hypothetical protein